MKVVIIGYGMAGARLARELGLRGADVTVFGAEKEAAYNRILLSGLLSGKHSEEDLSLPAPPPHVELRLGEPVVSVDRENRTVNGVRYDKLVLATGADAVVPPIPGLRTEDGELAPGVCVFRSIADAQRILTTVGPGGRAIVLGGGLLGLEAARGLAAGRDLGVTVVHAASHLMERQLDPIGGMVLQGTLSGLGVETVTNAAAVSVEAGEDGIVMGLADGRSLSAELLVVSCGVRANIALAESMGLATGRGVVVDDNCRTSDENVYAIGDCAEHRGQVYGLVGPAWEQAEVVADALTGGQALYEGSRLITRLKAGGIDLAAMGDLEGDEVVSFVDPVRGTYARLVIAADRITGAVLLGDNPTVGRVVQLFDRGEPVPADRRSLLLGRSLGDSATAGAVNPVELPDDTTMCNCNGVDKGTLTHAWHEGARSVAELARKTRATTGCGGCAGEVGALCAALSTKLASAPR